MEKGDRKCIICCKEYKFCGHCSDQDRKHETWRYNYCSEQCRNIFHILSLNAKKMLSQNDLSNLESFREDFKKQIQDIMKTDIVEEKKDDNHENNNKFKKAIQPQNNKQIVKEDSKK